MGEGLRVEKEEGFWLCKGGRVKGGKWGRALGGEMREGLMMGNDVKG